MKLHRYRFAAWVLAASALGNAAAAHAGTGRVDSAWMPLAPRIDGVIGDDVWDQATSLDLAAGLRLYLGNDARTLYVAVFDENDFSLSFDDVLYLHFDDEGGASPVLDDGTWTHPACQSDPELGEGSLCPNQDVTARAGFAVAVGGSGLVYEAAIPLDGPMPLRAAASRRIGIWVRVQSNASFVGCVPSPCGGVHPVAYRNLYLAGFGCNSGPQGFDGGLPVEWRRSFLAGSGDGWVATTSGGSAEHCDDNVTGGSDAAMCVATGDQNAGFLATLEPPPFTLRFPSEVELRFQANYQTLGAPVEGFGVESSIDDGASWQEELAWEEDHGNPNGPGELGGVDLSKLTNLSSVRVRFGAGSSIGNVDGGFAQIDGVELRCSPEIFLDGFETRLTTHWSATVP